MPGMKKAPFTGAGQWLISGIPGKHLSELGIKNSSWRGFSICWALSVAFALIIYLGYDDF
jgi:hypothetical protein